MKTRNITLLLIAASLLIAGAFVLAGQEWILPA